MTNRTRQAVLFEEFGRKPVEVQFDQEQTTTDGGAILLPALDGSLGLTDALTECLSDPRQPGKVDHETGELLRQRVFGIACGYVDCTDSASVKDDPVQKQIVGRDPVTGPSLASQSSLSRFENRVTRTECVRLSRALFETVVSRHRKRLGSRRVKKITLDLDGSVDPTHGRQQLGLFNRFYDTWCYFPLFAFMTFNEEPKQYAFAAILRSGHSKEVEGSLALLQRVVPELREQFPCARIRVRLDGGFQGPDVFRILDELRVEYFVGMAKNSVLVKESSKTMRAAKRQARRENQTVQRFGEIRYSAKSWKKVERKVVFKAEHLISPFHATPKDNLRFVVTNSRLSPRNAYREYCRRGDCENRIGELKQLDIDRTSCHRATANQFRILQHLAAYVLFQELQLRLRRSKLSKANVSTLRTRLLKIGGHVKQSVRRIVFHLSSHHPWWDEWKNAAKRCGASLAGT